MRPGTLRSVLGLYFAYFRPSFHPWDLDDRALLEAWKQELRSAAPHARVEPPGAPA